MKGWIALLLTAVLLCQLEPVHAVLHQNLPWLPETPPIELPRFYLTREDAVRSQEENDGNSGPEEDQPVMAEPSPEDEWALLLVNADHPIDREFCPELEVIQPGEPYQADARIVDDLRAMMEAARQDGVDLLICSAYRSYDQQAYNLQRSKEGYLQAGYSPEQAAVIAGRYIAPAGGSEHQTGLAVDIVTPSYQILDDGYANTAAAQWLLENAADYGFILRYPRDLVRALALPVCGQGSRRDDHGAGPLPGGIPGGNRSPGGGSHLSRRDSQREIVAEPAPGVV